MYIYVCMYMHIYIYSILINDHKDMNTYICLYIYIILTHIIHIIQKTVQNNILRWLKPTHCLAD